jgi:hypothetical protein
MSLPVPSGNKHLTDQELALLATSPTWAQSPNGWFDRSGNDDDAQANFNDTTSLPDRHFDQTGFIDDVDGALPILSSLLPNTPTHFRPFLYSIISILLSKLAIWIPIRLLHLIASLFGSL